MIRKHFYCDQYASLSVVESVPCLKLKLSGFPQGSDHYRLVQLRLLETIRSQVKNYWRLHLLTDSTDSGLVLEEDIQFYKTNIVPRIEEAGIRYHAIVLPPKFFATWMKDQTICFSHKLKMEYFYKGIDALWWLKRRS